MKPAPVLLLFSMLFFSIANSQTNNSTDPALIKHKHTARQYDRDEELRNRHNKTRFREAENNMRITTQNKRPLSFREESTVQAIIADFQVNENAGPNGAAQDYPAIAVDTYGNFIITWLDGRNGNPGIYVQRLNGQGVAKGNNFQVNDDTGYQTHSYPAITTDSAGNFIITWFDARNGDPDIYAQRFNREGVAQGSNFRVNDDSGSAHQNVPAIAVDGAGNFIITWQDERNGEYDCDIYAQRFNNQGIAISSNFQVNDDSSTAWHNSPAIAVESAGNFVITWVDERHNYPDIYAQCYNSQGVAIGSNFRVSRNDIGEEYQQMPDIVVDGEGNFIITWLKNRNGNHNIHMQRYDRQGNPLRGNRRVNDERDSAWWQYAPAIAADSAGNFIITWSDKRNGDLDIYAQRYNSNAVALGTNFRVTSTGKKEQNNSDVAMINNRIFNTWISDVAGDDGYDIWANVLDWNNPTGIAGEPNGSTIQVSNRYRLEQNYPNPFNPVTTIEYQLLCDSEVSVTIYNITGELVKTIVAQKQLAGNYRIQWDGRDEFGNAVAGGVYLYLLQADNFVQCNKMVLL